MQNFSYAFYVAREKTWLTQNTHSMSIFIRQQESKQKRWQSEISTICYVEQ